MTIYQTQPILLICIIIHDLLTTGTFTLKSGLAQMTKGGLVMDVVNAEQARLAEEAGVCIFAMLHSDYSMSFTRHGWIYFLCL